MRAEIELGKIGKGKMAVWLMRMVVTKPDTHVQMNIDSSGIHLTCGDSNLELSAEHR